MLASKPSPAFTLVELAIVLVIIGLIIGGVLVGVELVNAAKIRQEASLIQRLQTAVAVFQMKYEMMPGDFSRSDLLPGLAYYGDGDGMVGGAEGAYAWYHLSQAKLVDGNYNGSYDSQHCPSGITCPASKAFANDVLRMTRVPGMYGTLYQKSYAQDGLALFWTLPDDLTRQWNTANTYAPFVRALDTKIDDGMADTGKFLAMNDGAFYSGLTGNCVLLTPYTAPYTPGAHDYKTADTGNDCVMFYIIKN